MYLWQTGITYWGFFPGGGFGFALLSVFPFIHSWKKKWRTIIEEIHFCICFQRFFFFFPHVSFLRAVFWMNFPSSALDTSLGLVFQACEWFSRVGIPSRLHSSLYCVLFSEHLLHAELFHENTGETSQGARPRAWAGAACDMSTRGRRPHSLPTHPQTAAHCLFTLISEAPRPWFITCPWKVPRLSHQWAGGFALILA